MVYGGSSGYAGPPAIRDTLLAALLPEGLNTAGAHEFFPQPGGNPPWCFCQDPGCEKWTAYLDWWHASSGDNGNPSPEVLETHQVITEFLASLPVHYSTLLGQDVTLSEALDLWALERAGTSAGVPAILPGPDGRSPEDDADGFLTRGADPGPAADLGRRCLK